MERLDKIISNYGGLARSDAKQYIKIGRIKVNGKTEKDPGFKICESDEVLLDGKKINMEKYRYFILNKPKGFISSTEPEPKDDSPNVISLFKKEGIKGLFPVGRLDKDTTGLLIVTNDGKLGHGLTAPGKHVDKTYFVKVNGILTEESVKAFWNGFEFKDFVSKPSLLEIIEVVENENKCEKDYPGYSLAKVTIKEGKFHQIKRMFLKVGCEVTELKRISMGTLYLDDDLEPGKYRELSEIEIQNLRMNI